MKNTYLLLLLALCWTSGLFAQTGTEEFSLEVLGTFATGSFDEGAAEIAAYDSGSQRVFFTNADANTVGVLDVSDPTNPTLETTIEMDPFGGSVNSLDVFQGLLAVAVEAEEVDGNGLVVLFNDELELELTYQVGVLPDMVTFSPDGNFILTANEGQPSDDYSIDPEGSISVIDISGGIDGATVSTAGFEAFNDQFDELTTAGVRLFGPNASVAQDLEPEYIAIEGGTAYVSLQENNAMAIVDLATATVTDIVPFGFKNHCAVSNGFDASNEDGKINIINQPVLGMYQPDAIATYSIGGTTYIVTANEGDARDYDTFTEEFRVADLMLDPSNYPDAAELQADSVLGRLRVTDQLGDEDGDGDFDQLYSYGARSFSIFTTDGVEVFDSGEDFERITAALIPENFNSNNDDNDSFDARSDDKGPEPEAVEIVVHGDQVYVLIGLERVGGVMVYNITNPTDAYFVSYINNRDFTVDAEDPAAGDLGVEDVVYVSAAESPTDQELVITANEVSGTITIFGVENGNQDGSFALRIIHNNDGESKVVPTDEFGGAARFVSIVDSLRVAEPIPSITLSSGDNYLPGPNFNANSARPAGSPLFDAEVLNIIGYDALAIGNHEFDFGPDTLRRIVEDTEPSDATFLSANLDFTGEPGLFALVDAGRIASRKVVTRNGEDIGIIGLTTPSLPTISSPRGVEVDSNLMAVVQAQVAALEEAGVNKIILISHLQSINEELMLAGELSGVDIIIAGGGDELLTNDPANEIGGQEIFGSYPIDTVDADGNPIFVVTTPGEYRYVGNLVVTFDQAGMVTMIDEESDVIAVLGDSPVNGTVAAIQDTIQAFNEGLADNIIATTEPALDGLRASVRTIETNQGNLVADAFVFFYRENAGAFGFDPNDDRVVGVQNGGGMRDDAIIPAGSGISELKTFDILPFPNFVSVLEPLTAEQFKAALENSVSQVENTSGRFLQVSGFEIIYDTSMVADSNRIFEVTLDDGTPMVRDYEVVAGAPDVTIVTNSFTAAGGDDFDEFGAVSFTNIGPSYQQALFDYLTAPNGLNGLVTSAQYPEGGEGRIRLLEDVVDGDVVASVNGAAEVPEGCDFPVVVSISTEEIVGSFTVTLNWDPSLLQFLGAPEVLSGYTGVINDTQVEQGTLIFNGARVEGRTGDFDIFTAQFQADGPVGTMATVSASFSAAASAGDFRDLLPELTINDYNLTIVPERLLGDVNGDGVANSTDALIILSFEVGVEIDEAAEATITAGFGDVNGDGLTNSTDALIILTFDAGIPVDFPVGEEVCPSDVASDNLLGLVAALPKANLPVGVLLDIDQDAVAGEIIEVPVIVDMGATKQALGSYGAVLTWNTDAYELVGYTGGSTQGFANFVVNDAEVEQGRLAVAHAYVGGAAGEVNILNLQLRQRVAVPASDDLAIEFTSLAAARTFTALTPEVSIAAGGSLQQQDLNVEIFPNPAESDLTVSYVLPVAGSTEVSIWNAAGQRVANLFQGQQAAGNHQLSWNRAEATGAQAAGTYLIRVVTNDQEITKRVILW